MESSSCTWPSSSSLSTMRKRPREDPSSTTATGIKKAEGKGTTNNGDDDHHLPHHETFEAVTAVAADVEGVPAAAATALASAIAPAAADSVIDLCATDDDDDDDHNNDNGNKHGNGLRDDVPPSCVAGGYTDVVAKEVSSQSIRRRRRRGETAHSAKVAAAATNTTADVIDVEAAADFSPYRDGDGNSAATANGVPAAFGNDADANGSSPTSAEERSRRLYRQSVGPLRMLFIDRFTGLEHAYATASRQTHELRRQQHDDLWHDHPSAAAAAASVFANSMPPPPSSIIDTTTTATAAIYKELVEYQLNLPVELSSSIVVRVAESRSDLIRAMITGPEGTPYENGCFFFDICLQDYPQRPPSVRFLTTGGGRIRFNPNLYEDGKVCLSLLGTWSGPSWQPGKSTLLQVLISIQGLILVPDPYFNEPGYESTRGCASGQAASERYNANIRAYTLKYAMMPLLEELVDGMRGVTDATRGEVNGAATTRNPVCAPPPPPPPPHTTTKVASRPQFPEFHDVLVQHFLLRATAIHQQLDRWTGATTQHVRGLESSSMTLTSMLPAIAMAIPPTVHYHPPYLNVPFQTVSVPPSASAAATDALSSSSSLSCWQVSRLAPPIRALLQQLIDGADSKARVAMRRNDFAHQRTAATAQGDVIEID